LGYGGDLCLSADRKGADHETQTVEGDKMRIAVVGATGRTGKLVTEQALVRGHDVIGLARNPDQVDTRHDRLTVRAADVLEPATLNAALTGADAVISTLGIGSSRAPTQVYSAGIDNVLTAMESAGVGTIAVISAAPVGREDHPGFQRRILVPILWRFFGASYTDMQRMEARLRDSSARWISVRPPRLIEKPASGRYRLGVTPPKNGRSIRYGDLATALLDVVDKPEFNRTAVYVSN
jgi:putative NADH-flavin reductase